MSSDGQHDGTTVGRQVAISSASAQAISPGTTASASAESRSDSQLTADEEDFYASFSVANHRGAIFVAYNGGLGPILETASACLEAELQLNAAQKAALLRDLPFRKTTFSKFVSIGRDNRLYDPAIRKRLPPKFTVLYLLSGLSKEDFTALSQTGLLNCGLRRSELERWRAIRRAPKIRQPKISKLPRAFAAAFKPISPLTLHQEEQFRRRLDSLGREFGMQVVYPADKCMTDMDQAIDYIREEVKRRVDHVVKQRRQKLKSYGGKVPSYLKKNPAAALGDIGISPTDNLDRVQAVLALIGQEKDFEAIRAVACHAYGICDLDDLDRVGKDSPKISNVDLVSADE